MRTTTRPAQLTFGALVLALCQAPAAHAATRLAGIAPAHWGAFNDTLCQAAMAGLARRRATYSKG